MSSNYHHSLLFWMSRIPISRQTCAGMFNSLQCVGNIAHEYSLVLQPMKLKNWRVGLGINTHAVCVAPNRGPGFTACVIQLMSSDLGSTIIPRLCAGLQGLQDAFLFADALLLLLLLFMGYAGF